VSARGCYQSHKSTGPVCIGIKSLRKHALHRPAAHHGGRASSATCICCAFATIQLLSWICMHEHGGNTVTCQQASVAEMHRDNMLILHFRICLIYEHVCTSSFGKAQNALLRECTRGRMLTSVPRPPYRAGHRLGSRLLRRSAQRLVHIVSDIKNSLHEGITISLSPF
jgi:hypothetical protein